MSRRLHTKLLIVVNLREIHFTFPLWIAVFLIYKHILFYNLKKG